MIKTFTQNDLIRFIYHETTEAEEQEITNTLLCDAELQAQYVSLLSLVENVDKARLDPSERTLQNIRNYSRGLQENR